MSIPPTILADPDDDHVLACAHASDAEVIVSGDKHLLGLGAFKGIEIITAAQAQERIAK
ncbi:MAG: PIN domain-containing protein [Sideroxyarcus sp.]